MARRGKAERNGAKAMWKIAKMVKEWGNIKREKYGSWQYPWFSSNGVNPVVALMLLFSANSTIGHLSAQFFWSSLMIILRIWPIEQFAYSVVPSVCGWNAVDMSSLVPMSLCSSCLNMDMNLVSQSDTIDSGTPWSLTTSLRNSHATSFAVTHIIVGTRCVESLRE